MNDKQPKHVFISYVRENQETVDRLCEDLENHGVKVWLDRKRIKPGSRWKDAIREAINEGAFFIACFSQEYRSKAETHMNEELTLAIERLRKIHIDREWFIPVLLSEGEVPARSIGAGETLQDINWVPLYEDWDTGIQKILSVIKPIPRKIQNLIIALRSEDEDFRRKAAQALGRIEAEVRVFAIPQLVEALKDKDKLVRMSAQMALIRIGPEVWSATIPTFTKAFKDGSKDLREKAELSLQRIFNPSAQSALIEALKDENEYVRHTAAVALGNIVIYRPKNARHVIVGLIPVLIEALKNEDSSVRMHALTALERIDDPLAQSALIEALKDENEHVRDAAAVALRENIIHHPRNDRQIMEGLTPLLMPQLIKALKNEDSYIRGRAVFGLISEHPSAQSAIIEALKDDDAHVRDVAVRALKIINTQEAQKALEEYYQKSK